MSPDFTTVKALGRIILKEEGFIWVHSFSGLVCRNQALLLELKVNIAWAEGCGRAELFISGFTEYRDERVQRG